MDQNFPHNVLININAVPIPKIYQGISDVIFTKVTTSNSAKIAPIVD